MRKLSFISAGLLMALVIFMSSCAKDDTYVSGTVSYIYEGDEYIATKAIVKLKDANTDEVVMSTTADDNGEFNFYPVPDGDYYLQGYYVDPDLIAYEGKSDTFTAKGKKNLTIDLVLRKITLKTHKK